MDEERDWASNYFNYFTEIEEHFQRARGTGLFLMSPMDWALIETWKNSGVPLEAVLRGIDDAFEKWRSRKQKHRYVNSVAYCAQAIAEQAQILSGAIPAASAKAEAPFSADELRAYLQTNASALREAGLAEIAAELELVAADVDQHAARLEELEQRLSALEERVLATLKSHMSSEEFLAARRELDSQLRPYRSKMTAEQIAMLEKQYLDRYVFERSKAPRLSLFYLH